MKSMILLVLVITVTSCIAQKQEKSFRGGEINIHGIIVVGYPETRDSDVENDGLLINITFLDEFGLPVGFKNGEYVITTDLYASFKDAHSQRIRGEWLYGLIVTAHDSFSLELDGIRIPYEDLPPDIFEKAFLEVMVDIPSGGVFKVVMNPLQ
jgi:hypothetical protein